ncbi:MAG: hypothetical protein HQK51_06090 [Oligoflexia bacterium]|nr:hypothetical protein [Oligoflexia bacterium]
MNVLRVTIFCVLVLSFFTPLHFNPTFAADLDSFLSMNVLLEDSIDAVNVKTNENFKNVLNEVNKLIIPKNCNSAVMEMVGRMYSKSNKKDNIIEWVIHSGEIDRYPKKGNLSKKEYERLINSNNIWREAKVYPAIYNKYNIPYMGGFINMNGYYIGPDKIDHALGLGIIYFANYISLLKRKHLSEEERLEKVLKLGYSSERYFIGMGMGQLLSYGDLEANWQGFEMYKSMCYGDNPRLKKNSSGKWELVREIDWRDYINAYMDELYNPCAMYDNKEKIERFHSIVRKKYCKDELLHGEILTNRFDYYSNSTKELSLNQKWVEREMIAGKIFNNKIHTLESICK